MNKCPVCKYAKCRWVDLKPDPQKLPTEELERVVKHNLGWIEMTFRDNNGSNGSAHSEERAYNRLCPYTDELERREQAAKLLSRDAKPKGKRSKVSRVGGGT